MDVRVIVETTAETIEKRTEELHRLSLPGQFRGDLDLKLEQGKALLAKLRYGIKPKGHWHAAMICTVISQTTWGH